MPHIGFVNGELVIGGHSLAEQTVVGDDGFKMTGTFRLEAHSDGTASSLELHGGDEPPAPIGANAHRFWPDADGNIFWQDNQGVSRMLHAAGGGAPGQWTLNGNDIYYSAGKVGIGTSTIPHGGVGEAMFAIEGQNVHANGPHIQITTDSDNYPLFQMFNWRHDDVEFVFDGYYDSGWKSSDVGSNYRLYKNGDQFRFDYSSGNDPGNSVSWNRAFYIDTAGEGIKYQTDLSSVFVPRSLVDKNYSDYKSILAQNAQRTGLTGGAVITEGSTDTTLDISSGKGYVTDYSDSSNPVITPVVFDGVIGYTPVNLATDGLFVVGIDSSANIVEFSIQSVSDLDGRNNLLIGVYVASGGIIARTVPIPFNLGYHTSSATDFMRNVVGPANIDGNTITPNGDNLSLDNLNGGDVFILSGNFRNDPQVPDIIPIPPETAFSFLKVFRQASPSMDLNYDGAPTTFIDPNKWDDGSGALASVSTNDFTIPVLNIAPNGVYYISYGQEVFNTMANAETALLNGSLTYTEYPTLKAIVRRFFIIVRQGTTNLSDTSNAKFFADGKFRIGGIATSGGLTPPGGLDGYVQFNNNGAFGGDEYCTWSVGNSRLTVRRLTVNGVVITGHMADIQGATVSRIPYGDSFGGFSDSDNLKFSGGALLVQGVEIVGSNGVVNKAAVESSGDWDTAYTHVSSDGSDHSFIDQSVTTSSSPEFTALGLGVTTPVTDLQMRNSQLVIDNDTFPFITSKFNSQGVAWSDTQSSRTPGLIFNGIAQDRPEISWYRGSRTYPEFSIRQHTTNDKGAEFYSGGGISAPTMTMAFNLGRVGIGKTNPNYSLQVHKDSAVDNFIQITNSTSGSTGNDGLIIGIDADGTGRFEMKDDEIIKFYTANSNEVIRTGRAGYVGQITIGFISNNEAIIAGDVYAGGYAGIQHMLANETMIAQNGDGRVIISYDSSQYLQIQTDNSVNIARFNGNGYFGIGKTNPSEMLDVNGNIAVSGTVDGVDIANLGANRIEGTGILRKIQLQVANGAIPGTNIDITKFTTQGRAYNTPTITDADDLAKSGSSGSYSLSTNGENLTLTLTETVTAVLNVGVLSDDLNNGGGGGYYVHTLVENDNIQFMVERSGGTVNLDWTDVTNTGSDFIIFDVAFITSN